MRCLRTKRWLVGIVGVVGSAALLPSISTRAVADSSTPSGPELFGDEVTMLGSTQYPAVYAGAAIASDGSLVIYATIGDSALVSAVAALDTGGWAFSFVAVPESLSSMLATTSALKADQLTLAAAGIHLSSWGPDPIHGQVKAQLMAPTSADFSEMSAALGASANSTNAADYLVRATALLQVRYGPQVSIDPGFGQQGHLLDGKSDPQPYTGGAYARAVIGTNSYSFCSTSFPVAYGSYPAYWVLSAGHCSLTGQSWQEEQGGIFTPYLGVTAATAVNNGNDDWSWIQGYTTFQDQVLGGSVNSPVPYNIASWELPPINSPIAWDGARTGEVRWVPLTSEYQCAVFPMEAPYSGNETVCNLIASPNSNPAVAQGGDSGGPVFQHTCSTCNSVYPIATIVGGENGNAYAESVSQELAEVPGSYIPTNA